MAQFAQESENSIFVGGLANTTTDSDLFCYFSQFGEVAKCEAQMWKNNSTKCRGFAVVTTVDKQTYDIIMQAQHVFGGRNIECKPVVKDRSQLGVYCKEETDKKVYVSGLPKRVSDAMLREHFSKFGEVKIAYIVRHHKDNKPKGFGFVSFGSKEAKEAVLAYSSHEFLGKQVSCTEYSTKSDLKKGPKTKFCQPQEDFYIQTSDNNSDQETQSFPPSPKEETSYSNQGCPSNEDLYGQVWQQGCQYSGYQQEQSRYSWNEPTAEYHPTAINQVQLPLYSPFRGSSLLHDKLYRLKNSLRLY